MKPHAYWVKFEIINIIMKKIKHNLILNNNLSDDLVPIVGEIEVLSTFSPRWRLY